MGSIHQALYAPPRGAEWDLGKQAGPVVPAASSYRTLP